MGIEIDSLPVAISLDGSEIVPIVQGGTTKRTTTEAIAASQAAVTSINISGGTTGLTVSGGPITTSGTMTIGGQIALATNVSGTLPVANGGTGATTLTSSGVLLGQGTSAVAATAALTNGQLLVGQTGADPLPKTISGDTTVAASGAVTVLSASTTFALSGVISATISADQNDWAPTGVGSATTIRVDGGAASRNITGLAGGATGRVITIHNIGSPNNLVLVNDSSSSSASNRLAISGDATLLPNQSATLEYDATSSRWRSLVSTITPGGAAAGTVTSVAISGGTTGLSTSGGPITTTGTITLAGTLAVANGGTGITSLGTGVATFLGTPSSANLIAAVTDETGTGALVFATSPTLVTPALGTPSAGVLTSCTGLPISTGVAGLGTGVATFLGTPSSANLAAAITDETGTGALVFATSPTLVTPALGTPSAGVLTSCTGLPISTGVAGLGTGVATFLETPSSANLASAVTGETGTGALVFGTSPGFTTAANPASSDGAALGTTALMWSDLFLASGGVINFNNGDVTISHSANVLSFAGASSGYTFDADATIYGATVGRGAGADASNTVIGSSALAANTTGSGNTAVGRLALRDNTTGTENTAVGLNALVSNTGGIQNTALGSGALGSNTTGSYNMAIGTYALYANTTGVSNTAVGKSALASNTVGIENTGIGAAALGTNTTGVANTAIGAYALYSNTTGASNTAIGVSALAANTTGAANTAVGVSALAANTTGAANTAVGSNALYSNTTGAYNTAVGPGAGYGSGGVNANTTGANNTFLGYEAVGASATASNVVTLGNPSIATLRCAVTTITAISDRRDKTDIEQMPLGENFVNALNPVRFTWDMRDKSKVGLPDSGFIAQELREVSEQFNAEWLGLVYEENPDRLEASPGRLIPVLVKAVQELSAKVATLERRLGER